MAKSDEPFIKISKKTIAFVAVLVALVVIIYVLNLRNQNWSSVPNSYDNSYSTPTSEPQQVVIDSTVYYGVERGINAECFFTYSSFGAGPWIYCSFRNIDDKINRKCFDVYIIKDGTSIFDKVTTCTKDMYKLEEYNSDIIDIPNLEQLRSGCQGFGMSPDFLSCPIIGGEIRYTLEVKPSGTT